MQEVRIRNQKELDKLEETAAGEDVQIIIEFGNHTGQANIRKRYSRPVIISDGYSAITRGDSEVRAQGESSVYAKDNSTVYAEDSSKITASDNSVIHAGGYSSVRAYGYSSVWATEKCKVYGRGHSRIYADTGRKVYLWDNARAQCAAGVTATAYDNSEITRETKERKAEE